MRFLWQSLYDSTVDEVVRTTMLDDLIPGGYLRCRDMSLEGRVIEVCPFMEGKGSSQICGWESWFDRHTLAENIAVSCCGMEDPFEIVTMMDARGGMTSDRLPIKKGQKQG